MSEKFLNNRLKFHSASRVGIQEGESLLAAANKDQHTVGMSSVWSSSINDFPLNSTPYKETTNTSEATEDLIKVFTNNRTVGGSVVQTKFNGGYKWTNSNYPAVTLYENVLMTPVANSNGSGSLYESYEILTLNDDGEKVRLQDWVSPVAMFDPSIKKPIPGYTGKVEVYIPGTNSWVELQETDKSVITAARGSEWAANYGNWEFIYYAGIVTFNADYTPSRSSWINNFGKYSSDDLKYSPSGSTDDLIDIPTSISDTSDIINKVVKLRWTGFLYTGIYLDTKVANTFAGITLTDIDLQTYDTVGIVRITDTVSGTKPPISSVDGFLQVMDINHDEDRNEDGTLNVKRRIRQIVYPDNQDESTPYSRVGTCETLDGTIEWSEWTQMGGGSLRRIVVDGTTTTNDEGVVIGKTVRAMNNVMYESFGPNTFTMPDPDTVPIGTRIGFEQFVNTANVISTDNEETFTQALGPDVPNDEFPSQPCATAISYIFECVLGQDGTKREWVLDVDHNYAAVTTTIVSRIESLDSRLTTAESDVDTLEDSVESLEDRVDVLEDTTKWIHGEFVNQIARQTKHVKWGKTISAFSTTVPTDDLVKNPNQLLTFLAENKYTLFYYDLIVSVMSSGQTITLPHLNVVLGTKVTFELYPTYSVTIKDNVNTESFSGDGTNILVLEFEYTYIKDDAVGWTLLSLA